MKLDARAALDSPVSQSARAAQGVNDILPIKARPIKVRSIYGTSIACVWMSTGADGVAMGDA